MRCAAATALGGVAAAPDAMFGFQKKWVKLGISVALDAVGASSYLLPLLGEVRARHGTHLVVPHTQSRARPAVLQATDAGWAPVSAILVQALYGALHCWVAVTSLFPEPLAGAREQAAYAHRLHGRGAAVQRRATDGLHWLDA